MSSVCPRGPRVPRLRRFRRSEDGSVTVETVLWLPVFLGILGIVVDMSVIYTINADMWHASFDAARRMARDEMTESEAQAHVRAAMPGYLTESVVVEAGRPGGDVEVRVRAPARDMALVGLYALVRDAEVGARVRLPAEGGTVPDYAGFTEMGVGAGAPAGGA